MRNFSDDDKKRKSERIRIQKNPGNLSRESLLQLEDIVKKSLKDGYLPCPVAWKIAKDYKVPKISVGEVADRLGIRITNCQLGCFKIEKTPYDKADHGHLDGKVVTMIGELKKKDQLTCEMVFEIARQFKLKPIDISNEISAQSLKIHGCQLGCF